MNVKTLLIVYKEKDESFFKQLKDMIDAKDDTDVTIGVEDGTVRTFKCSEKQWLEHKTKGRANKLADKILFIDDIKDVCLTSPKYNKYGISYGTIDEQQFAIVVDEKFTWDEDTYTDFKLELEKLTDNGSIVSKDALASQSTNKSKMKKHGVVAAIGLRIPIVLFVAGGLAIKDWSEARKNADILRNQMLCFAITKVYLEELDKFIKE